jgi:glycosyltransferase involved in cell wall biosynthesis
MATELKSSTHERMMQKERKISESKRLNREFTDIQGQLMQKDRRIRELNDENSIKSSELNSIKSSVTWKAVTKWQAVVDFLMPHQSSRRRVYDLGLISLKTFVNEGWGSFRWKVREYRRQKSQSFKKNVTIDEVNVPRVDGDEKNDVIDTSVSVVIPVKNGGRDYDYVLDRLKSQKGIKELEIIVVDSGSTDDTLEISKRYGVNLIQIKPKDFSHGMTRNLGVEKAGGEFVILVTADAIASSEYLVYKMVKLMENDRKIAAVTCSQVPRSDADLMGCFQVWGHYKKFLDINEDKIVFVDNIDSLEPGAKRKAANLSDSFCCMRREVFLKYRFMVNFAEDLDLGIRYLRDGYKLAYLCSAPIVHSHNRKPAYFFKVSFCDSKIVSQIVGNEPMHWNTTSIKAFHTSIRRLYADTINMVSKIEESDRWEPSELFGLAEKYLNSGISGNRIPAGEKTLDEFFREFENLIGYSEETEDKTVYNFLLNSYIVSLRSFKEYATAYTSMESMKEDLISTLYKLFANSAGAALGNFSLFLEKQGDHSPEKDKLDKFLLKGV